MPWVPDDVLKEFADGIDGCLSRMPGGAIRADTGGIRALVRAHPEAAVRYVEIHLALAGAEPSSLANAGLVATAHFLENGAKELPLKVIRRAEELGELDRLRSFGMIE